MTDTIFRIEYIIGHEMELYERRANIQQIFDTLLLLAGGLVVVLIDIIQFTFVPWSMGMIMSSHLTSPVSPCNVWIF